MALKIALRPHEKIIIGGSVIANGSTRSDLIVEKGQLMQIGTAGKGSSVLPAPALQGLQNLNDMITICHATGSTTNPYVAITVSVEGATYGHAKHPGDIIPAPADGCPMSTPNTSSTPTSWNIAGQTFLSGASTVIFGNPQPGDWVRFESRLLADGSRFADRIVLLSHSSENQFTFIGKVESIDDTAWTVSSRVVQVNEFTAIEAGLKVGDNVHRAGRSRGPCHARPGRSRGVGWQRPR